MYEEGRKKCINLIGHERVGVTVQILIGEIRQLP